MSLVGGSSWFNPTGTAGGVKAILTGGGSSPSESPTPVVNVNVVLCWSRTAAAVVEAAGGWARLVEISSVVAMTGFSQGTRGERQSQSRRCRWKRGLVSSPLPPLVAALALPGGLGRVEPRFPTVLPLPSLVAALTLPEGLGAGRTSSSCHSALPAPGACPHSARGVGAGRTLSSRRCWHNRPGPRVGREVQRGEVKLERQGRWILPLQNAHPVAKDTNRGEGDSTPVVRAGKGSSGRGGRRV